MPAGAPPQQPAVADTADSIRVALQAAREQGAARQRKVQRPLVVTSAAIFAAGLVMSQLDFTRWAPVVFAAWVGGFLSLMAIGVLVGALALLPTQPRAVRGATFFLVLFLGMLSGFSGSNGLAGNIVRLREEMARGDRAHDGLVALFAAEAFAWGLIVLAHALSMAYTIRALLRWRQPARALLDSFWRALSWPLLVHGLVGLPTALVEAFVDLPRLPHGRNQLLVSTYLLVFVLIACFGLTPSLRVRLQAWLTSRGREVSAAAAVSVLLGATDADTVIGLAQETFRAVRLSEISVDTFEPTNSRRVLAPDGEEATTPEGARATAIDGATFYERAQPVRVGEVDAFVSHSWSDPGRAKWNALERWCARFRREHGREPLLWVDHHCIDSARLEEQLKCLPVYLSGCNRLLVLMGATLFDRLWCIVELFTFVTMGGAPDHIDIVTLDEEGGAWVDAATARSGAAPSGPGSAGHEIDVRNAQCAREDDYARLFSLIESYPAGIVQFNAWLNEVVRTACLKEVSMMADVSVHTTASVSSTLRRARQSTASSVSAKVEGGPSPPSTPLTTSSAGWQRLDAQAGPAEPSS